MTKELEEKFFNEFVNPFNKAGFTKEKKAMDFVNSNKIYFEFTNQALEEKSWFFFFKKIKGKYCFICLEDKYKTIARRLLDDL